MVDLVGDHRKPVCQAISAWFTRCPLSFIVLPFPFRSPFPFPDPDPDPDPARFPYASSFFVRTAMVFCNSEICFVCRDLVTLCYLEMVSL